MNNGIARFTTRIQGKGDGLFVGGISKQGLEHFKPNTVYEIRDILGVLTIVEVGQALGTDESKKEVHNSPGVLFHWGHDIGHILGEWGKYIFLTRDEYKKHMNSVARMNKEMGLD